MGTYYGVKRIKEFGKKIDNYSAEQKIKSNSASKDSHIIAILNNGLYSIAGDVTEQDDFKSAYDAYSKGAYLTMDYYEISTEKLGECPDEGRVYES